MVIRPWLGRIASWQRGFDFSPIPPGDPEERTQIKWLLFSGAVSLVAIGYRLATYDPDISEWTDYLLLMALLRVAISISIAIFRYRLYDIDIIIRRTFQYTVLSGLLALIYFGSVMLLQTIFDSVTQKRSAFIIVVSMLLIAGQFTPLLPRVQRFIDRRFYHKVYDVQQILAEFAQAARDEVLLAALEGELNHVIQETMQPEALEVWYKERKKGPQS